MRLLSSRTRRVAVGAVALALTGLISAYLSGGHAANKGTKTGLASQLYAPGPAESDSLDALGAYWHARVTYPTGAFNQRWLLDAAREDRLVKSAVPAGARRGRMLDSARRPRSPLALGTTSFTSLGPTPLNTEACQQACFTFGPVSGRVNAIAIDQTTTTPGSIRAYFGSDGGGIWKSTNCCTPASSWTVKTDDPLISTMTIDDITIDPNNASVLYAGTGDLTFGSFSFGSSGILKSIDAGEHWQMLADSVFTLGYPANLTTFPQYQAVGKVRVDPNNSNRVVAGTKTGLYVSYDAGVNWTGPCYTNAYSSQRQDITSLILTKVDATTTAIYAAVGARGYATTVQPNLAQNGANGIYASSMPASGCPQNWTLISRANNGWSGPAVGAVGSGTPCGLLVTTPPAPSQVCPADTNKLGRIDMAVAPSDPKVMYAEVQAIDYHADCGVLHLALGGGSLGCFLGLWRTGDGGATWTKQSDNTELDVTNNPLAGPCGEDMPQHWYNQGLAVDPGNPDHIFMDGIEIWGSTDGGNNLTNVTCGYGSSLAYAAVHVDQHALAFAPPAVAGTPSTTLLSGSDGGIYVSNDAQAPPATESPRFTQMNTNMNGSTIEFYSGDLSMNFATAPTATIVAGAQDNGSSAYTWSNPPGPGPAVWSERTGGDGVFSRLEPKLGQRAYSETPAGGLRISQTGAMGPYTLGLAYPWGSSSSGDRKSFVFPYEVDKFDCKNRNVNPPTDLTTCDHMIAGSYRVFETVNGGLINTDWKAVSPDLTKNTLADRSFINQLAYANTDNRVAIVGTNDGNVQYGFRLGQNVAYVEPPTATSPLWVNVTQGNTVLPNRPILDVAIKPDDPLVGWAAVGGFNENTASTPGHVFQVTCTAACASFAWANKTGNLPNIPVDSIIANPHRPKQVFAGTDWGLYFTDDITVASPVWNRFDNGLPHVMVWDLAIDRGATTLAAFTRSRGAYAVRLASAPTAVKVAGFRAQARAHSVELTWRTGSEVEAVGFNVWRSIPGNATKVNRKLIAAKAAGSARGAAYRFVDRTARAASSGTYRLQVVKRDGTRSWVARTAMPTG